MIVDVVDQLQQLLVARVWEVGNRRERRQESLGQGSEFVHPLHQPRGNTIDVVYLHLQRESPVVELA